MTVYVDADVSQTMMKNNADRMQNLIDNFFADCGMIVAQSTKKPCKRWLTKLSSRAEGGT